MIKGNVAIFIIIILLLSCCKQKEKIITQGLKHPLDKEELEKKIFRDEFEIQSLKLSKIKMEVLMNDEEFKTNSTIGIIRDSIIVISLVPALGYEIARIYCTIDSLFIIDRQNKNIYASRIDEQLRRESMRGDYYLLQGILMNKAVLYDREKKDAVFKKDAIKEGNNYYYTIEQYIDKVINYQQIITIEEERLMNKGMMVTDYLFNKRLNIRYDDFKDKKNFVFPMMIEVNVMDNKDTLKIKLNVGDVEINGNINAVINLPPGYNNVQI